MNQENVGQGAPSNTEVWDSVVKKKKSKWIYIVLAIILVIFLAIIILPRIFPSPDVIGTSGLFTQEEVDDKTEKILALLALEDYETVLTEYGTNELKTAVSETDILAAKESMGADWGAFTAYGSKSEFELEDSGIMYAIVQAQVIYENRTVLFTLYFDETMQLAGIYMK